MSNPVMSPPPALLRGVNLGGWLLLEKAELEGQEHSQRNFLAIVDHLNRGRALIQDPAEAIRAAELNLLASELVRTVAAFKAAFHYISTGIQLLPENSWQDHYDLTLELYSAAVEVSLVNGDLSQAEKLAIITETNSHTLLEKVRIMNIRMDVYVLRNQIDLVIELGIAGIHLLDFDLEVDPPQIRSVEQMNRLSEMTDARALLCA